MEASVLVTTSSRLHWKTRDDNLMADIPPTAEPAAQQASELGSLPHEPTAWQKKLIAVGIGVFLISQILIPASYYFGAEPTSERFSWRMFSSIDLSTWDTRVVAFIEQDGKIVEQPVQIEASLQETYVKTVQRAQFDIVEPFMRKITELDGVQEVRFEAQGEFPSGKLMDPIRLSMKRDGELVRLPANPQETR